MTKKRKKENNVIATHIVETHVSPDEEKKEEREEKEKEKKSDDSMSHTLTMDLEILCQFLFESSEEIFEGLEKSV
jgi:hypothetical protein